MSTKLIFLVAGLAIATVSHAQEHLSVYLQAVTGGQWVKNPGRPEDGTFSYDFKTGWGAGVSYEFPLNKRFSLSYRINYSQKGFKEVSQYAGGTNQITNQVKANTLHYVGLDQLIKFRIKSAYIVGGIRNDYLAGHNLDDETGNPQAGGYISSDDYHQWSFGGITGVGYHYKRFSIEGGMNYDIAPSLETDDALIRNFVWYANLGFYIL